MNLAGYIRVSTEGQVDAFGKDVQRSEIGRWAGLNGHEIVAWYEEDGVSGKTDGGDRPELARIVAQADLYDGIVAFDATRIARRLYVQETLLGIVWASGLRVFTTTAGELCEDEEDPTRIMIRQILGVIAEFDHRNTVKRLHSGRKAKSAQGGYIGGTAPYGMMVLGTGKASRLVPNDDELAVVRQIRDRHARGDSLRDIAEALNRQRIRSKTGKLWAASQVQRIIKRYENT